MTVTPSSSLEDKYPTLWRYYDVINKIEVSQLSEDLYQIRTPHSITTLAKEGFEVFCTGDEEAYANWLQNNNFKSVVRLPGVVQ